MSDNFKPPTRPNLTSIPGGRAQDAPSPEPHAAASDDDGGSRVKTSAATVLVELALLNYTFGVATTGEPYALPKDGPKVVRSLRGGAGALRPELALSYFNATGKAAPAQALADALLVLEGQAATADPVELHLRVAEHDGDLWLDLGDATGRAVRINATGWSVEPVAPVLFRRGALTSPLPVPQRGGSLDDLWSMVNVTDDARPLLAAWLVSAFFPSIPHPVLAFSGEQGSGKSTASKTLGAVVDPSPVPVRKAPRDVESWIVAANGSWIVCVDNVSSVPDWWSDSICRAVTGDGDVRRRLYSDGDVHVFSFRRVILLNGIEWGTLRGDLAERLLAIELSPIPSSRRRRDGDLAADWARRHPVLLGALLDLTAGVAGVLPAISLPNPPRMADFAHILAAVDSILGTEGMDTYLNQGSSLAADAIGSDPAISAIVTTLNSTFIGSSHELLEKITPADPGWRAPRDWPKNPKALTGRIRRNAPALRRQGWQVTDNGTTRAGVLEWQLVPPTGDDPPRDATDSTPSTPATPAPGTPGAGDAGMEGIGCGATLHDHQHTCEADDLADAWWAEQSSTGESS